MNGHTYTGVTKVKMCSKYAERKATLLINISSEKSLLCHILTLKNEAPRNYLLPIIYLSVSLSNLHHT